MHKEAEGCDQESCREDQVWAEHGTPGDMDPVVRVH